MYQVLEARPALNNVLHVVRKEQVFVASAACIPAHHLRVIIAIKKSGLDQIRVHEL